MEAHDGDTTLYVHNEVVISNSHVASVELVRGRLARTEILVSLNSAGKEVLAGLYADTTTNRWVVTLIEGKLIAVGEGQISGDLHNGTINLRPNIPFRDMGRVRDKAASERAVTE